jgi:hypothetical protein
MRVLIIVLSILVLVFTGCSNSGKAVESESNSTNTYDSSTSSSSSESKTAGETTGYDWKTMTSSEKYGLVSGVITAWKNNNSTVTEGPSWFIEALDAFYGSEATDSTNVAEAMSLCGVSGGVVQ